MAKIDYLCNKKSTTMPKKLYKSIPKEYAACLNRECPRVGECLHGLAYELLLGTNTYIRIINPQLCTAVADCQFYRSSKPVRYARGFTHFQQRMFPNQYARFKTILTGLFGRNPYFERRRGDTALTPTEQELILNTLKSVGVTEEMEFDSYEEAVSWYD